MSLKLGCIADDYTGASDLANTLTRQGLRTIQTIGVPRGDFEPGGADAVVVALKTRSVPAAEAVAKALAALDWLRRHGAAHVMFKICSTFDSTDQGNIGPVTEALAAALGAEMVPVTPAFPETGRTVFQGHLFVGTRLLQESPLKDHPLNPMRDSDLVRVLGRQSTHGVGLVALETVSQGRAAIAARLAALRAEGVRSAIVDAVCEADLVALGAAALPMALSTGASGLGLGLARALRGAEFAEGGPRVGAAWASVAGPAAIIAGSCSVATREQIAAAEQLMPVLHLDIARLLGDAGYHDEVLGWALGRVADGPVLLASSATPDQVALMQSAQGAQVGARIEAALARMAGALVAGGVRRMVVAGGETSGAVIDRLGVEALEIGAEIAPGVPVLRSLGEEPMLFALKSGNFGGNGFFSAALAAMGVVVSASANHTDP